MKAEYMDWFYRVVDTVGMITMLGIRRVSMRVLTDPARRGI
jgi:hypothetical protein